MAVWRECWASPGSLHRWQPENDTLDLIRATRPRPAEIWRFLLARLMLAITKKSLIPSAFLILGNLKCQTINLDPQVSIAWRKGPWEEASTLITPTWRKRHLVPRKSGERDIYLTSYNVKFDMELFYNGSGGNHAQIETHALTSRKMLDPFGFPDLDGSGGASCGINSLKILLRVLYVTWK